MLFSSALFSLILGTFSLKCYDMTSKDLNASPQEDTLQAYCNSSTSVCYKAVLDIKADESRYSYLMYGCDESAEICTFAMVSPGECRKNGGVNVCCCSGS